MTPVINEKNAYLRHVPHVEGVFDGQVTRFHELQVQIPKKKQKNIMFIGANVGIRGLTRI